MIKIDSRTSELESGVVCYAFDKALVDLKDNNFEVVSLPQMAQLRIQEGKNAKVSKNGNYVREGVIYIPKEGIYLARNSPLLQLELAKEAVQSHRNGREYFIETKIAEEYREKASQEPKAEVFQLKNLEAIPTNRFNEDERTLWLFQSQAEDYGDFLRQAGIKEMPFFFNEEKYINKQEKPYANQLWLRRLDDRSLLFGGVGVLYYVGDVRGVRQVSDNSAQKISEQKSELYTSRQITSALKALKLQGLEDQLLKKLRKR